MNLVATLERPCDTVVSAPVEESPPSATAPPVTVSLSAIFRQYRWTLLVTYVLFAVENLLRLSQPFLLGWAIDDLLEHSYLGLLVFAAQHISHLVISSLRRMYDARSFTRIYTDMASRLVMQQRRQNVALSRITARTALSRELVDFFEQDLSVVLEALASLFGALIMLAWYDLTLVSYCVALFLPLTIGNRIYRRWLKDKHRRLHDQLEKEVEVIEGGQAPDVKEHFGLLARLRIRLSDGEALHFGIMELFILGLIVASMARSCAVLGERPGEIYAVFRYVMMFIMSLDSVPMLVQRISRVRDVCRRFET